MKHKKNFRLLSLKLIIFSLTGGLSLSEINATPHSTSPLSTESLAQLRATTERTVQHLTKHTPSTRTTWRMDRVGPALMLKLNVPLEGADAQAQARFFIERYAGLWGRAEVNVHEVTSRNHRDIVVLTAQINGLPIVGQQARLSIQEKHAQHLSNGIGALHEVIHAQIKETVAGEAAIKALHGSASIASIRRVALPFEPGQALEAFEVRLITTTQLRSWIALVDGRDGAVIQVRDGEVRQ